MRRIITAQLQSTAAASNLDGFFDRVIKYIPADMVGAWLAITGLVDSAQNIPRPTVLWSVLVVMTALSFGWTIRQTKAPGLPTAWTQAVISSLSFVVWSFAIGGPFKFLSWYEPVYGSIVLILFTVSIGLVVPRE